MGTKVPWNKGLKGAQVPWNKGLKGVQVAWNKGLIKDTDSRVAANAKAASEARKHSDKFQKACSEVGRKTGPKNIKATHRLPRTQKQIEASRKLGRKYGSKNSPKADTIVCHHNDLCHGKERPDDVTYMTNREHVGLHSRLRVANGTLPLLAKNRSNVSGADHCNWKGSISIEPYGAIWYDEEFKTRIRERDNNKCMNPSCRHTTDHLPLCLHHIDYNKKDSSPFNVITLCRSCNTRANYNRDYWQGIYTSIINELYLEENPDKRVCCGE